jgi:hypothetical protein
MATLEEMRERLSVGLSLSTKKKHTKCVDCGGRHADIGDIYCETCKGTGYIEISEKIKSTKLVKKFKQIKDWNNRYAISADGRDCLIKFGKYNGCTLSHIYGVDDGYLVWMLNEDFPNDLKDVCRFVRGK